MEHEMTVMSTFESSVESVDVAEAEVRRFTLEAGFDDSDQYFIGLAAREILINAVKHGNGFDRNKKVSVRMSRNSESLTIEVFDEGEGFQLEKVPNPLAPENLQRQSGRGITIALAIMDEFFVEKNQPHGTHIRMLKHIKKT
jgi:serine/threonine-protein kinase RsbW